MISSRIARIKWVVERMEEGADDLELVAGSCITLIDELDELSKIVNKALDEKEGKETKLIEDARKYQQETGSTKTPIDGPDGMPF